MFKYFELSEFECSETHTNEISIHFVYDLDTLRGMCGFPFIINPGYRDPSHSAEVDKPNGPGTHSQGIAADIAYSDGAQLYTILRNAFEMDFTGIGVADSFVHLDKRTTIPVAWSYNSRVVG